uniref:Interleukin-17A n=1 Tax=Callorhinchus milii TaxID=7868 RepID=V9LEY3_CALMI
MSLWFQVMAALCVSARAAPTKGSGKADQEGGRERGRYQHQPKYTLSFRESPGSSDWSRGHSQDQGHGQGHAGIKSRSISPWIYKNNYDPDRYPATIWEAHCVHSHCINARGKLDEDLNTQRVWQRVLVLRRESSASKLNFLVEEIPVPVACVCVRARVLQA